MLWYVLDMTAGLKEWGYETNMVDVYQSRSDDIFFSHTQKNKESTVIV